VPQYEDTLISSVAEMALNGISPAFISNNSSHSSSSSSSCSQALDVRTLRANALEARMRAANTKSSSSSSSSNSQQSVDLCASRIQQAIQEVKNGISHPNAEETLCSITQAVPKDPVVINCGHIYERSALIQWQATKHNAACPLCHKPITSISEPVSALRNLIKK